MGAYTIETLIRKWKRGELTVEQVVGQILLHVQDLQDAVGSLERRLHQRSSEARTDTEADQS